MLKRGPFSKCYWFLSSLKNIQLKMTSRRHLLWQGKCLCFSWLLDPLSFPSCLNGVLETIVLSAAEWRSDPDGSILKCSLRRVRCGPCCLSSSLRRCVVGLTLQLCSSFGFCPLKTARRPQEKGFIIEEGFSLFESDLVLLHKEVGSPPSCTVKSCSI